MADGFSIKAFQGQGDTFAVVLVTGAFSGSEPLTAAIWAGDTSPAALTVTPTWINPAPPSLAYTQVALPLLSADLATLTPGSYSVLISLADSSAPLAKGFLEVYPSPGGLAPPYYRSLASPAFAESMLPNLTRDQIEMLPAALPAATRAIEAYVGRGLVLDSYDHFIRPSNTTRLRLRTRPVVEVSRLAADVIAGAIVTNGTSGASSATVRTITTAPNSLQIKSLVFTVNVGGTPTTQTLTMSDYPTFGALADAINALGNGWSASTQFGSLETADAFGTSSTVGALHESPWIHTHSQRLGHAWPDQDQGFIELDEPTPGGYLIRNRRMERTDSRWWGVRATYRAGYATSAADIALGYYPVPEDLKVACIMTANAIIEATPALGPVKSQSVKDRSYTLQDNPTIIPAAVQMLLQAYQDFVV